MKFLGKISIFFLVAFILSGCGILSSKQKTEINLLKDETDIQENTIEEEKTKETQDIQEEIVKNDEIEEQVDEVEEEVNESSVEEKDSQKEILQDPLTNKFEIKNKLVSWGFSSAKDRKIDTIVIHSSYNAVGDDVHDLEDIIYKEYKPYGVSPHYIISRTGKVYRLVEEKNIAYHAGESEMPDGRTGVNAFSIGIEIVNTKSEKPNDEQYEALGNLLAYLKGEYKIKYVLGHSDIAPGRKDDPWNFDWGKVK